jgi:carbonic anhydrase
MIYKAGQASIYSRFNNLQAPNTLSFALIATCGNYALSIRAIGEINMQHNYKLVLLTSIALSLIGNAGFARDGVEKHHKAEAKAESHDSKAAPHWSYDGHDGPENWGILAEAYGTCASGTQQSPIDLMEARLAPLPAISIDWKGFVPTVINNGHTIQVNSDKKGTMVLDGKTYTLLQFHFHHNSEHTVNGRHYPLEAHFVHQAEDGALGVLGVFFKEGQANPALQKIWNIAPLDPGQMKAKKKFKPGALLPRDRGYFRYEGSLTTPPCSEVVSWAVFDHPLEASRAQIDAFAGLYADNYRPVQNTNRRFILHTQ